MHHFILPSQDTWISSGSSTITAESFKDQNFGKDQLLEVKKFFYNDEFNHQTRGLVQFSGTNFTNMSQSIVDGIIANPKFYLKLYEIEGNSKLSDNYTLHIQPISQSWVEGTGKFGDNPKNILGCSWENRNNVINGDTTNWADYGGTILSVSSSTQTFLNESSDIEVEVTNMVNMWLSGQEENYGMLIRISGSQETDESTFCNSKFFSSNTHTIYPPRMEFKWDDSVWNTTASMDEVDIKTDPVVYLKGRGKTYKETSKTKFRVYARKQYRNNSPAVGVTTNQMFTEYYLPSASFYSIKDTVTEETIIPFSDESRLSADTTSNYFNVWMNGFQPERYYKFEIRVATGSRSSTTQIVNYYDDDWTFKVTR